MNNPRKQSKFPNLLAEAPALTPAARRRMSDKRRALNAGNKHRAKTYEITWPNGRKVTVTSMQDWCRRNESALAKHDRSPNAKTRLAHRVAAGLQQEGVWHEFKARPV